MAGPAGPGPPGRAAGRPHRGHGRRAARDHTGCRRPGVPPLPGCRPMTVPPSDGRRPWLLVIDTATSRVVVAAAAPDGTLLGATTWEAGRTHGGSLLPAIGRLHGEANLRRSRIRGVIVGTGPGAFTGLRVGLATAKAIAHELRVPIAGVSTAEALLRAAARDASGTLVLLMPAGPNDRHVVRS